MKDSIKIGELELDLRFLGSAKRLVIELISEVLPLLKDKIKESAIDASDDGDGISAASAKAPVAYAIVAAYQFRWFVTQVTVFGTLEFSILLNVAVKFYLT